MIVDTHAHYDDARFDEDREQVLLSTLKFGVEAIINSAADFESLEKCRQLSKEYDFLYFTSGIHPTEIEELDFKALDSVREYAADEKCLGIGEIGLDYHWVKEPQKRERQKEWFIKQLEIAKEMNLPVVIHSRDACEDTMNILKEHAKDLVCDIHCFSYSPEVAVEYVKMGYYIGVGGVVTFDNAKKLRETVEKIPLTSILTETDCPYLAPNPFRGERNDSSKIPYVIRDIADIKGTTENEVYEVTRNNAWKFYGKKSS